MLRVGYPAILAAELFSDFPAEVELIALPDDLDHEIEIDVWIPDPYPARAMRIWQRLRGVRLVLSLMAGTEWIPGVVGPRVTICNARGAHNISTAEWTVSAILATLKYFPFYLDVQRGSAASRPARSTRASPAMRGPSILPSCSKSLPASECCWWATAPLARKSNGCSRPLM
jgi:phosphoglycerate dehydrogenase-like enzyme